MPGSMRGAALEEDVGVGVLQLRQWAVGGGRWAVGGGGLAGTEGEWAGWLGERASGWTVVG